MVFKLFSHSTELAKKPKNMVSLNSRVLRSIQFSLLFALLHTSAATSQGICDLRNDPNETATSKIISPSLISATNLEDAEAIVGLDGQSSQLILQPYSTSGEIRFSDFQAQLPLGSVIQGIEVLVGASASNSQVTDVTVRLYDGSGAPTGIDKANKSLYGDPWSIPYWTYGGEFDMWQADLEDTDVNSSSFGVSINLYNASSQPANISFDQLDIRVHYYMPLLICGHPCVSIVSGVDPEVISYRWTASPELVTEVAFNQPHIFNIFADQSPFGDYEICVTRTYASGESSNCCRALSYRDCTAGSIGDQVWADRNGNGIFDADEVPQEGVRVELYGSDETMIASHRTGPDGAYRFDNILLGEYYLRVDAQDAELTAAADSDAVITNLHGLGTTSLFSLLPGETRLDLDFGVVELAQVCGQTFIDANVNSIYDLDEEPLAGVNVEIKDSAGVTIDILNTDADGAFCSQGLRPGNYSVEFISPDDYQISGNSSILQLNLESGQPVQNIEQGYFKSVTVSGSVWLDANGDEIRTTGEDGIAGIEILLTDCMGSSVSSTTTSADGTYLFTDVPFGNYIICSGTLATTLTYNSSLLDGTDCTQCLSVDESTSQNSYDFAVGIEVADIDFVSWLDENNNGQFDQNETPIALLAVDLINCQSTEVVQQVSDNQGAARFEGITSGAYFLDVRLPEEYLLGNSSTDFTAANGSVSTSCIDVAGAAIQINLPLQLAPVIVEETTVEVVSWLDTNANGQFDPNETPVSGLVVNLVDCLSSDEVEQVTNNQGSTSYDAVLAGTYYIEVTVPEVYEIGSGNMDFTNANGSGTTSCLDIMGAAVQLRLPLDVVPIEIEAYRFCADVYDDINGNNNRDNNEDVVAADIFVYACTGGFSGALTQNSAGYCSDELLVGEYELIIDLPAGYTLGVGDFDASLTTECLTLMSQVLLNVPLNREVQEQEGSITVRTFIDDNENAIRESDEVFFPLVEVGLYDCSGTIVAEAITDFNGEVVFEGLASGNYYLQYNEMLGYTYSNDDLLVGPFGSGTTDCISLSGTHIVIEEGYHLVSDALETGSIRGLVWLDANENGLYEISEQILQGIEVVLLDLDFNMMTSTITTTAGYFFDNLTSGQYIVQVLVGEVYSFTQFRAGGVSPLDSEVLEFADGMTQVIVLDLQDHITDINAGLVEVVVPESSISGRLWFDENSDGFESSTELGLVAAVSLMDRNNNLIASLDSDSDGFYIFENVLPGDYFIEFESLSGYSFIPAQAGGSTSNLDSDVVTSDGRTSGFVVEAGEQLQGINAGYSLDEVVNVEEGSISGIAWVDANRDGLYNSVSEVGLAEVVVELLDASANILSVTKTDAGGAYSFINLPAGIYVLRFESIENFSFTETDADLGSDLDSDVSQQTGITRGISLGEDAVVAGINAGYQSDDFLEDASISGLAWIDLDGDGAFGGDEEGLVGVQVSLIETGGVAVAFQVTNQEGRYAFNNLAVGSYSVRFSAIDEFEFVSALSTGGDDDSEVNPLSGTTRRYDLAESQQLSGINAGYVEEVVVIEESVITGLAWFDDNGNGKIGLQENGISEVAVELLDANGQSLEIQLTDKDGRYSFINLVAGTYSIRFGALEDYMFTQANAAAGTKWDSDVDEITGITEQFVVVERDFVEGINAGYRSSIDNMSSISGLVWLDNDEDGLVGPTEEGFSNVRVFLRDPDSLLIRETLSSLDGRYEFSGLTSGEYFLSFDTVDGYIYTTAKAAPGSDFDSDVRENDGYTRLYGLNVNEELSGINAGYKLKEIVEPEGASISGQAWFDEDVNGLIGDMENGLEDVRVFLRDRDSLLITETLTNADGNYVFSDLEPGFYILNFESVDGFVYTTAKVAAGTENDSDVRVSDGYTRLYAISEDQQLAGINAGYRIDRPATGQASISGMAWLDANQNGLIGVDELGIEQLAVTLYDGLGNIISQAATDGEGRYQFDNLESGNYQLIFEQKEDLIYTEADVASGTIWDSEVDANGQTQLYALTANESLTGINAGYRNRTPIVQRPSSISGRTWLDLDKNGLIDTDESGVPDVDVYLRDQDSLVITQLVTDADGQYIFSDIPAGQYFLSFGSVDDLIFTTAKAAVGTTMDSDVRESDGYTRLYNLAQGQQLVGINSGYQVVENPPAPLRNTVAGIVWEDFNGNGLLDNSEDGTPNLRVRLLSESDEILETTLTDASGRYAFEDLEVGNYKVDFFLPLDTEITIAAIGNDAAINSDLVTGLVTDLISIPSVDSEKVNAGYYFPVSLGGLAWLDVNSDGIRDDDEFGTNNYIINLFDDNGVFVTRTFTNFNQDGEQGHYFFGGLRPGGYYIQVFSQQGVSYSDAFQAADTRDSDISEDNGPGTSATLMLQSGGQAENIDIGLILAPSTIGDFLWIDDNGNGVQDDDEIGLNGIVVELYNNAGEKVNETVTANIEGQDGRYLFEDMYPTEYYVQFLVGDDYVFTASDLGGVDSKDSDVNNSNGYGSTSIFLLSPGEADLDIDGGVFFKSSIGNTVWHDRNLDGLQDANEPGVRDVLVTLYRIDDLNGASVVETTTTDVLGNYRFEGLSNGDYYLSFIPDAVWEFTSVESGSDQQRDSNADATGVTAIVTISNNQSRDDIDAGLIRPSNQIGGQVWDDTDANGIYALEELLLENVVVQLMSEDNVMLAEVETDLAGRYVFDNLDDGDYYVSIVAPSSYVFTEKNLGSDDQFDSDFDATGASDLISLSNGDTVERHIDAGLISVGKIAPASLFPNPVTGPSVSLSSFKYAEDEVAQLLIFDEQGALHQTIEVQLDTAEGAYEKVIDISQLPTGFYYLKLNYQRRSEFLKLIKID